MFFIYLSLFDQFLFAKSLNPSASDSLLKSRMQFMCSDHGQSSHHHHHRCNKINELYNLNRPLPYIGMIHQDRQMYLA